jgi:two-component system, NtrC family, response regulator AtoC
VSEDSPKYDKSLPQRSPALEKLLGRSGAAGPAPAKEEAEQPLPESPAPAADGESWELERLRGQLQELRDQLAELKGLERSHGHLLRLLEANTELLVAGDTAGLPEQVLRIGLELVGAERAAFFRIDGQGALGIDLSLPSEAEFSAISRSVVRDALVERRSVVHQGRLAREGLERQSILDLDLETVVATPLMAGERLMGVLYLDGSEAGRFGRADIPVLEIFSRLAAAAMLKLDELDEVRAESRQLQAENIELKGALGEQTSFGRILAASPVMLKVIDQLRRMTRYRSTVRITGETGTGKELIARALHSESAWADQPFVAINCGALPENLLEAELFGHVKGAFTGAEQSRPGLFEQADGGTLFLDEIGDMPPSLQVKLLRVLETGEFRRVGGQGEVKVDVRLIAATHVSIEDGVANGDFREDLYYRLNVLTVELPPLRQRPEDVALLAEHFLALYAERLGLPAPKFTRAALRRLQGEPWPGNVRQLEKCVERSLALFDGGARLDEEHLALDPPRGGGFAATNSPSDESLKALVARIEGEKITATLAACGGKVTTAAAQLGISRQYLHRKLRDLGLRGDQKK